MKRILMVKREVTFAVSVEIADNQIGKVKVLTSATEAKLLLEQAADLLATPTGMTLAERSAVGFKP